MAASMQTLISLLGENEQLLDELAVTLDEEQRCIVTLDLRQLAENNSRKVLLNARLKEFRDECCSLMQQVGSELGCQTPNLSALVTAAGPRDQQQLRPLQSRLASRAGLIERKYENNRRILEKSNSVISATLSLMSRTMGGCDTYGMQGRVSSGVNGMNLVRREM